ncbi:hypothetical protein [Rubrivivax gelatinosus]|uniref:hypothetical protein n=1 Tax=Rubrivivax gelatinosus TaxID=28068 RepID=UPI003A7F8596
MNEGQPIDPRPEDDTWDRDNAAWALGCEAALPFLTAVAAPQDEGRTPRPVPGLE